MAVRPQRSDGLTVAATQRRRASTSRRSSSTACSRPSTGATASTSASTRRRRCGGASGGGCTLEGLETISALQERLLHDPDVMQRLLLDLSINVTAMFRDPTLLPSRSASKVVPLLRTYPFTRIWVAGLLDRARRCTRSRSCSRRRGCTSARASTRPTSTRTVLERARAGRVPARRRCRTTRATTSPPAASARSPTTTRRRTTARRSTAR